MDYYYKYLKYKYKYITSREQMGGNKTYYIYINKIRKPYMMDIMKNIGEKYGINMEYVDEYKKADIILSTQHSIKYIKDDIGNRRLYLFDHLAGEQIITTKFGLSKLYEMCSSIRSIVPYLFHIENIGNIGNRLDKYKDEDYFIFKPDGGFGGRGIKLFKKSSLMGMDRFDNGVIQRYIENPMLIDNKKFHIRSMVLVMRIDGRYKHISFPRAYVSKSVFDYSIDNPKSYITNAMEQIKYDKKFKWIALEDIGLEYMYDELEKINKVIFEEEIIRYIVGDNDKTVLYENDKPSLISINRVGIYGLDILPDMNGVYNVMEVNTDVAIDKIHVKDMEWLCDKLIGIAINNKN